MKKLSTKKTSKKTIANILQAFESNRITGITEFVGNAKMGSFSYQDIAGEWVVSNSTNLPKALYKAGINEDNINTVKLETATSHKKLLQLAVENNEAAASSNRFVNMNKGHGGIKRPVRVYNTKSKVSVTVDSAYEAARMIGTSRDAVRNRLDGFIKDKHIGNYTVSYAYTI